MLSKDITLPTKVRIFKAMVFPVVMYECESWIIKKAERWRTDAFEVWCWRRLLKVLWKTKRSNQSILKEINPEYFWKHWYWSWSSNTLASWLTGKDSEAGKDWRQKKRVTEMRWLDGITNSTDNNLGKLQKLVRDKGSLVCCSPWGHKESDTVIEQIKMNIFPWQDFLGGPSDKTLCFHYRGCRFSPWLGN